jgi:peroxin-19
MLDEFSATSIETKEQAPSTSGPGRPGAATVVEDDGLTDDDFAKQLQAGMADLFGDLGNDV